jgi:hypothetical protein
LHALYRNLGNGRFLYSTPVAGIAALGRSYVGFGTGFLDVDNDGWEDLVVANGHVIRHPAQDNLRQRLVLLHNQGNGRFVNVSVQGGPVFQARHVARGVAVGDLDNDGWPDLVISRQNEPVLLLRNVAAETVGRGRHWLGVELVGRGHRDVVGARLVVEVGGRRLTRFARGGGSYLSSGDRRHLFGLATAERIDRLTVVWPRGGEQSWQNLTADRYWRLREGEEKAEQLTQGK